MVYAGVLSSKSVSWCYGYMTSQPAMTNTVDLLHFLSGKCNYFVIKQRKENAHILCLFEMNYGVTLYAVVCRGAAVTFQILHSVFINQFLTD